MQIDNSSEQFGSFASSIMIDIQRDANFAKNFPTLASVLMTPVRWNFILATYHIANQNDSKLFANDIRQRLERFFESSLSETSITLTGTSDFVSDLRLYGNVFAKIDWEHRIYKSKLFTLTERHHLAIKSLLEQLKDVETEITETNRRIANPNIMLMKGEYKDYFLTHLHFNNYDKQPLPKYFDQMIIEQKRLTKDLVDEKNKIMDLTTKDILSRSGHRAQLLGMLKYIPNLKIYDS